MVVSVVWPEEGAARQRPSADLGTVGRSNVSAEAGTFLRTWRRRSALETRKGFVEGDN